MCKITSKSFWHSVILVTCAIVLPGCATLTMPKRLHVQQQWAQTFRELGIVPVFPPREDVYVGDMYAYAYNPDDPGIEKILFEDFDSLSDEARKMRLQIGMSPRLGRMNLNHLLDNEYTETLSAPATSNDYNGILGNPAFEASKQALDELRKKLVDLDDAKMVAIRKFDDAEEALLQSTRNKKARDDAATKARAEFAAAQGAHVDVSFEQSGVNAAAKAQREADDRVLRANRAVEDAPDDGREAAQRELTVATRAQQDAVTQLRRANEALTERQQEGVDANVEHAAVAVKAANDELEKATEAELLATYARDDAKRAQSALDAAQAEPRKELQAKIQTAEALHDAVGKAGARMLYAQPRDANKNVFTGSSLPVGITADDAIGSRTARLRLVGFPDFSATSFSQGDLSGLVPLEALGLGMNVSRNNIRQVSVKIPAAESYGLSTSALLETLLSEVSYDCEAKKCRGWIFSKNYDKLLNIAMLTTGKDSYSEDGSIYFRIIAEVYYARAMDVGIYASKSFGMRTQVDAPMQRSDGQKADINELGRPKNTATHISSAGMESVALAAQLGSMLERLGTMQSEPGGSIQLVNASDSAIGVRRVFDRPIAIGFRALVVHYDIHSGMVKGVWVSGSGATTLNIQHREFAP